jgi:gamma-glutamyltranspeptidase/glutathione hydrolase
MAEGGGTVLVESGIPEATVRELEQRGHTVRRATEGFGGYQAIARDGRGVYRGATESRKDGQAAGY